jgi:hypothetical protein
MAEETILSWNFANWVTVLIMVVLGFALLGMAAKIWKQKTAPSAS